MLTLDELEARWNANADHFNQWSDLGIDEIVWFAQQEWLRESSEYAALRSAAEYAAHQLEKARVWNGMQWTYNPLHPIHYLAALGRLRGALRDALHDADKAFDIQHEGETE